MVTRSRKRRWVRSLTTRSTQVSAAEAAKPPAAHATRVGESSSSPSANSISHSAISASGSAAAKDSVKAMTSSAGSAS